jgi:predicted HicB family RNase H-like nuclease
VKYKGYTAVLKADEEQGILFGRVLGLRDVITFQAETVSQAIKEFHISVDTYLELCRSRQQSPEKPYSGNFMVRVNPELHRQIAILAQTKSVSINSLVASLIRDASKRRGGSGDEVRSVTSEKVMAASKASKKKSKREAKVVQHKRKASTR